MTLKELEKKIHNQLARPYNWEKVGLGDVPVQKAAAYAQDQAAHLAQWIWIELFREGKGGG